MKARKVIATNRKAAFNYNLLDNFEAGLVLMGSEIKSIRNNRINLQDGFVQERAGELWLMNVHISPYEQAAVFGHKDPLRPRKLLLHRKEIGQILQRVRERGLTIVPLTVYLEGGKAKVTIALAQGKKLYDKRADIARKDSERDIQRALKGER
jgi:SsrA-binding protein